MIFEGAPKIRAWALLERWGISFPKFGMYGVLSETGTNFPKIRDMLCEIRDELNPRFSMLQPSEDQIPPNKQKKQPASYLPSLRTARTTAPCSRSLTAAQRGRQPPPRPASRDAAGLARHASATLRGRGERRFAAARTAGCMRRKVAAAPGLVGEEGNEKPDVNEIGRAHV